MKDFLKQHGLWVLFAAAVLAVALAVLSVIGASSSPLTNALRTLASPFRAAYSAAADWLDDRRNYYRDVTELEAENAELRRRLAEVEETVRQAEADREENAFLRDLLDLRSQRRDLSDFETAAVTERNVTNWTSSLTLNKGTSHGVEVGDCVVDGNGMRVGLIQEAGWNWSTVLTVVDTDTSVGARIFRTRDLCLAEGDFAMMGEGRLRLNYLPAESSVLAGDLVLTSGLGGYLPPDLVIGTVEDIRTDESGAASYAVVRPAADIASLDEVCVIKSFEIVS